MPHWIVTLRGGKQHAWADVAIAASVFVYGLYVLLGSFQYSLDARLYPLVAGAVATVTAVVFLGSSLRAPAVDDLTPADDEIDEKAGKSRHGPGSAHDVGRAAWVLGAIGASLFLLFVLGVYVYIGIFTILFGRWMARLTWTQSLLMALGLLITTFLLFDQLMGIDVWDIGVLVEWMGLS